MRQKLVPVWAVCNDRGESLAHDPPETGFSPNSDAVQCVFSLGRKRRPGTDEDILVVHGGLLMSPCSGALCCIVLPELAQFALLFSASYDLEILTGESDECSFSLSNPQLEHRRPTA